MTVGVITAMPSEMKPFARHQPTGVVTTITGIGTKRATAATQRLLDANPDLERVLMVGIAGGLRGTSIGDVIVPETVIDYATGRELHPEPFGANTAAGAILTTDEFFTDAAYLAELEGRGVIALDMETAAVGAVCDERGIPWSVFRAISDRPSDGLVTDAVFKMANSDGSPNLGAVVRYVARQPWRVPKLVRIGREAQTATRAAAAAAHAALSIN